MVHLIGDFIVRTKGARKRRWSEKYSKNAILSQITLPLTLLVGTAQGTVRKNAECFIMRPKN